jgi:hypothetical protein
MSRVHQGGGAVLGPRSSLRTLRASDRTVEGWDRSRRQVFGRGPQAEPVLPDSPLVASLAVVVVACVGVVAGATASSLPSTA